MHKSVAIIGGGLGGLFTAAILAKEGLHVVVLEKNSTIGGGLQSFRRFGEVYDTGMHVIGGMQEGGSVRRICEYLDVYDESLIDDVNPECASKIYVAEDNTYYTIRQGREGFVESLSEYFPQQKENLRRYVEAMFKLTYEVPMFYLRKSADILAHDEDFFIAADDFIAKYISDAKLRGVVAYMNPLYAGRANTTPAYIHSIISVLCINGTSRFAGGSSLFADKLCEKIVKNGGKVYTSEGVSRINTCDKKIVSLTTTKGNTFTADYYISDVHPSTLIKLFDNPKALPKAYRSRLDDIPNSYSAFTLNIKFKPRVFRYIDHTAFYMRQYDDVWRMGEDDADAKALQWPLGFLYMTPPEIEQGEYTRKMIVTVPMSWSKVELWENTSVGNRPDDYKAWKKQCAELVIQRLEKMHPGFRDCIEAVNTASPLTVRDFYGVKEGGMCGYVKDCNNITLSHVPVFTKIPNLLLTGQCINLHGFCGVPLTAINTSEAILGRDYVLNKINKV